MPQFSIYAASAPVFVNMLNALSGVLDKAEADSKARNYDVAVLLQSRLAPDMFPLTAQIHLATSFAKNAVFRLTGQSPPDFADLEPTLADARARIAKTLDLVQSMSEADFNGAAEREITIKLGPDTVTMSGADYLNTFLLPNFYFHLTVAYAILRHNGVPLGKRDFMGR
jgi:uncharacterized protein